MEINYLTIIATIINFSLLIAIIIAIYKAVSAVKNFINRNKELDKKVDTILSKLDDKDN
jgi:large-conductance mechanosensitive channel